MTYDNHPLLLTDAIDHYRDKRTSFSEPELWHLLYTISQAQDEYSRIAGARGKLTDIRPANVFLSDKGKARLANPLSWPGMQSNEKKIQNGEVLFFAPE